MRFKISDLLPSTPVPEGLVGKRADIIICDELGRLESLAAKARAEQPLAKDHFASFFPQPKADPFASMNIEELEGIRESLFYVSQEAADKFFDDHIRPRFEKNPDQEIREWFEEPIVGLDQAVIDCLDEDGFNQKIHPLEGGGFVISNNGWLPGVYEDYETAEWAFEFDEEVLARIQDTKNDEGGDQFIRFTDLVAAKAKDLKKDDWGHTIDDYARMMDR